MTKQEKELWSQYTLTRSIQARNALAERYRGLVEYCATRIWLGGPRSADLDDMISEGMFGLFDAIARFEPARGNEFTTYASKRIRGRILDWLRSLDHVSRLTRSRAHQVETLTRSLRCRLGRQPTPGEIAAELGPCRGGADQYLASAQVPELASLSRKLFDGDSRDKLLWHCLADRRAEDPSDRSDQEDLVAAMLRGLDRAEQLIMRLYHLEGLTMREIGDAIGISESRVSQMHGNILLRLKTRCDVRCAARN